MRQIISNRLTFSKCLTTAPSAGCERPKQLQSPREDGRRTPRQIEYTKKDRDFDGVSNRLTFSKCLTTASSAGCERPNQLQTPREDRRRTARQIEYTKIDRDFAAFSNRLTTASSAGCDRPKQLQTPSRTGEERRTKSKARRKSANSPFSNRLTFSKCLTTASSAGCGPPKQLQTLLRTGEERRTNSTSRRWSANSPFSNRLTFSKCLTTASSAGCGPPKQLQTPLRTGEERRTNSTSRRWSANWFAVLKPSHILKVSHDDVASRVRPPKTASNTLEDRRRTASQIEFTKKIGEYCRSQTVSHSQSVSRPNRLRRLFSCLCRSSPRRCTLDV